MAVLVVGSRARADTPADQWSDTDLALVVDDPAPYLASAEWLGVFGRPLLTFVEPTAVGPFAERRVLFETGLEVDFALLPVAAARWMGAGTVPAIMWVSKPLTSPVRRACIASRTAPYLRSFAGPGDRIWSCPDSMAA